MAKLYKRPGSPFWWLKARDPVSYRWTRESTGLHHKSTSETRKAQLLVAEKTLKEARQGKTNTKEHWVNWVEGYLIEKHGNSPGTLQSYRKIFTNLSQFFEAAGIPGPRQVQHAHAGEYYVWRQKPHPGLRAAKPSTVVLELRIFSWLMQKAVASEFAYTNPLQGQRFEAYPQGQKKKPLLSEQQIDQIAAAVELDHSPSRIALQRSFIIARYQGCRLSETWLNPMTDVTLPDSDGFGTIKFTIKGGKEHMTVLHPQLVPLFTKLRQEGATETYPKVVGKKGFSHLSAVWSQFFERSGLRKEIPGICHHCLRVALCTRLYNTEVPTLMAMNLIGHSSFKTYKHYVRPKVQDLKSCMIALLARPSGTPAPPKTPDAPANTWPSQMPSIFWSVSPAPTAEH